MTAQAVLQYVCELLLIKSPVRASANLSQLFDVHGTTIPYPFTASDWQAGWASACGAPLQRRQPWDQRKGGQLPGAASGGPAEAPDAFRQQAQQGVLWQE